MSDELARQMYEEEAEAARQVCRDREAAMDILFPALDAREGAKILVPRWADQNELVRESFRERVRTVRDHYGIPEGAKAGYVEKVIKALNASLRFCAAASKHLCDNERCGACDAEFPDFGCTQYDAKTWGADALRALGVEETEPQAREER